ncbi:hypothetical protein V8G54_021118 [Vigna mungo]|uniref:Uncharacterized protein n=1 Tax=Vigna mungo TaxID=3915 RepID=A0AAQ3RVD4_VIGMU
MGWDGMLMEMSFDVLECEDNAAAVVIFFHDLKVEDYYFIWFHDILADCRICVLNASDGSLLYSLTGHTESPQGIPDNGYLWQRVNSQLSYPTQPYSLREALAEAVF